jgi:hypothetical protein
MPATTRIIHFVQHYERCEPMRFIGLGSYLYQTSTIKNDDKTLPHIRPA